MKCREFEREDTEQAITVESDDDFAADHYAYQYLAMTTGDVAFIEVLLDRRDSWELWRVECVLDAHDGKMSRGYLTSRYTKEAMLHEIETELEVGPSRES